jgi:hypothetical protein
LRRAKWARWVDRRWQIATEIVRGTATRHFFRAVLGYDVRLAIRYIGKRQRGCTTFSGELAKVHQAWSLRFESEPLIRTELEARLLCQSIEKTAAAMKLPVAVVDAYESLFFAVQARIDSHVYIFVNAIGEQVWTGCTEADVDIVVKTIAYAHGPIMLDLALEYYRSWYVPKRLDVLGKAELQKLLLLVQAKAMIEALTLSSIQSGFEPVQHLSGGDTTSWAAMARELRQSIDGMPEQSTKPLSVSLSPTTINWLVGTYQAASAVDAGDTAQKSSLAG